MASNAARILIQLRPGAVSRQCYSSNTVRTVKQVCIKRGFSLCSTSQAENKATTGSYEKLERIKSYGKTAAKRASNTANAKLGEMNCELKKKGIQANESVENAKLKMESAAGSAKEKVQNVAAQILQEVPSLEEAKSGVVNAASAAKQKAEGVLNAVSKEVPSVQDVSGAVKRTSATLAENIQDSVEKTKKQLSNANATGINGLLQKILHFFRGDHPNAYEAHPVPQQGINDPRHAQGSGASGSKGKL